MDNIANRTFTDETVLGGDANSPTFPDGFFFNNPEHLHQQTNGIVHWLLVQNPLTGQVDIQCAFGVRGEVALSPMAAPFGSIEFAETVSPVALGKFANALIEKARLTGCKRLRLVNYPHCYAPRTIHRLVHMLTERGFDIIKNTPTFYLPVSPVSLTKRMNAQERQRLRKGQRAGLVALLWANPCVATVVDFIRESRRQQGYPLTISMDCLSCLLTRFPEEFPVFMVRDGQIIATLCVCVRVRHDILYAFLPADNPNYKTLSPMVMLIDHLYQYSQYAGISLLDLGPSLDANHAPKPSLARFKQNMGAITSPKMTFEIEIG